MRLDYPSLIRESEQELLALEKRHRYTHLVQRLKMLRRLKSGRCTNMGQVAKELDYSLRQCQRWFNSYRWGGLAELLDNNIAKRGRREWENADAWQALQKALGAGEIASYKQAQELLAEHGVVYKDETGVLRLFKRHQIKAKTGRYRHEKTDKEVQADFKKTSPTS
jgi:transposase